MPLALYSCRGRAERKMPKRICAILIIVVMLVASGCARKTMILSEPPGAQVLVDGQEVCMTPCAYNYKTGGSGHAYEVVLEKDGYDPVMYQLRANEVDQKARNSLWTAGLMIPGGSLLWIGSIFTNKLQESYHFVLREDIPVVALHEPGSGR